MSDVLDPARRVVDDLYFLHCRRCGQVFVVPLALADCHFPELFKGYEISCLQCARPRGRTRGKSVRALPYQDLCKSSYVLGGEQAVRDLVRGGLLWTWR